MNRIVVRIILLLSLLSSSLLTHILAQTLPQKQRVLVKYAPLLKPLKEEQIRTRIQQNSLSRFKKTLKPLGTPSKFNKKLPSFIPAKHSNRPRSSMDLFELEEGFSLSEFLSMTEVQNALQAGEILDIELDQNFELSALPNDPDFDQQWGLSNTGQNGGLSGADIQAPLAWNVVNKGAGIVGLVDTGIDYAHPDLVENIWQNLAEDADGDGRVLELINGVWQLDPGDLDSTDADGNGYVDDLIGWDFVNHDNNPFDDNGHGTHVAGIIGARGDNGIGISGVAWEAQIMALKTFNQRGQASISDILPALAYAREMGVSITNNSWGGTYYSRFLREEIALARDAGQICVAAAGNSGYLQDQMPIYPASYELENILAVCASTESDYLAGFSSYDSKKVDLAAPGRRIYSTAPGGNYESKSGTSMAAGFVSGAILLLQEHSPNLNMAQIISQVLLNVDPRPGLLGKCRSGGRINLFKTLKNESGQSSSSGLFASFSGPYAGCVNNPVSFFNTSLIPNIGNTDIRWYVDGNIKSLDPDFTYTFRDPGFYEIKLHLNDGQSTHEKSKVIEITEVASSVDLGPDTSLCAAAYVLGTQRNFPNIRWIKLNCPGNINCLQPGDFTVLDSLEFKPQGGHVSGFASSFVLTDQQNQILEVSNRLVFKPQSPGIYRMHAVYHWLEVIPAGMVVGNQISDIDLGIDTCGQILPPHEFEVFDAELLGTSPYITVRDSGLYVLDITDACGNRASDTLKLDLTPGCVWPGDINDDGQVNMLDFLSLGIANGNTGPPRPNASPDWEGQIAIDWTTSFDPDNVLAPGMNHKYADPNGDGTVDLQADKDLLEEKLGFIHQVDIPDNGQGPSFYLKHLSTLFSENGDTAKIEIGMYLEGANETDVEDFYGIAFNLNFSDPIHEKPLLTPAPDWLGPMSGMTLFADGNPTGFGAQFLPRDRRKSSFGLVSANRRSSRGRGLLACGGVVVIIDDIADSLNTNGISHFSISSENIVLIDSIGRALGSANINSLNTISIDLDWTNASCESLGFGDADADGVCNPYDICPDYDDFIYPGDGLLQVSEQGNFFASNRIHFQHNKLANQALNPAANGLKIVALAHESDSNFLAMVNDFSGTLANYRLRLEANGNLQSSLLNANNGFTFPANAPQVLAMAHLSSTEYLILYSRNSYADLITMELSQNGTFTHGRIRSSNSGLPTTTLALALKSDSTYYALINDGGLFPALYEAHLKSDWTFDLRLLHAESRISLNTLDFAYVEGRLCPACQQGCQDASLSMKVFLEGPYNTSTRLMEDAYRENSLITYLDPYGLQTYMSAQVMAVADEHAIVDWLKVELRDPLDPQLILAEKAVLVQRDGDVVDKDGNSLLNFDGIPPGSYYLAVKHTTHLGAMTYAAIDLSVPRYVNFSSPQTALYSNGANGMKNEQGVRLLWAGDANGDGLINAVDKNLHWIPQNGNAFIYGTTLADFNLDGLINAIDVNLYWKANNSRVAQLP